MFEPFDTNAETCDENGDLFDMGWPDVALIAIICCCIVFGIVGFFA